MTKVKICGLTTAADIDTVNALRPDFVGFVFAPASRRYVAPSAAAALRARLDKGIRTVGVFANAPAELPVRLAAEGVIDLVQLHGGEDDRYMAALRSQTACPLIQAFRVESAADIAAANRSSADFPLLDNGAGGTGQTFNWALLEGMRRPFFLAGGLNPENVGDVVRQHRPYAVDVSSGVETDGRKDFDKISQFLCAARGSFPAAG